MSPKDENKNVKNKKDSTNTKKDENENMLLEYMEDVDDKLFIKSSNGKSFNRFINGILIVQQIKKIKKKQLKN